MTFWKLILLKFASEENYMSIKSIFYFTGGCFTMWPNQPIISQPIPSATTNAYYTNQGLLTMYLSSWIVWCVEDNCPGFFIEGRLQFFFVQNPVLS